MGAYDWMLEILLIGLLSLTLLHAVRLQRALGELRRERSALGDAVAGFDASTRDAQAGMGRLHIHAQEIADQVAAKVQAATALKDDLGYLSDRGEQLANRLEALVRSGRALDTARGPAADGATGRTPGPVPGTASEPGRPSSQAERDLMLALRGGR